MTLQQPIFHPSTFHTLHFNTPGPWDYTYAPTQDWHLGHFLAATPTGQALQALSLDWQAEPGTGLIGPGTNCLPNLNTLTHLHALTVSLQALFGNHGQFLVEVGGLKAHTAAAAAALEAWLPGSLSRCASAST